MQLRSFVYMYPDQCSCDRSNRNPETITFVVHDCLCSYNGVNLVSFLGFINKRNTFFKCKWICTMGNSDLQKEFPVVGPFLQVRITRSANEFALRVIRTCNKSSQNHDSIRESSFDWERLFEISTISTYPSSRYQSLPVRFIQCWLASISMHMPNMFVCLC